MIFIYKATSPNNNTYIGITNNFNKRIKDHVRFAKNKYNKEYNFPLKKAIRKYGSKISWEVIDIAKDYTTAHELEKRYILHFDSYNNGYNSTYGGEGVGGREPANKIWSKDKILKEAKKYSTRQEFKLNNTGAYSALNTYKNTDFYNECTSHMLYPRSNWSKDLLMREASKFLNKSDWEKGSPKSYEYALKRLKNRDLKTYKELIRHMSPKKHGPKSY